MSNVLDDVVEGYEALPQFESALFAAQPAVLLSLDIGTSGTRAALFDESGNEIVGAAVRVGSISDLAETGRTDADFLVEQVTSTIDLLLSKVDQLSLNIQWVAVSCFWHSLVGVDKHDRPTTPVFGWSDTSAAAATKYLRRNFDERRFHQRTGCRFHPSYWPAKLVRLRQEQPDTMTATSRWLSFADYLQLRLCGATDTSVSMASGTGLLVQKTCKWDEELLTGLEIDIDALPTIDSGFRACRLTDEFSRRWPALSEAQVFPAIGDGAANNIGAGCTTIRNAALMIGSSGAVRVFYEGEPPARIPPELWCYRGDPERVVIGGALSDGGNLHASIRRALLNGIDSESLETELASLEPDAHGLTILPFWSGERSTGWHEDAAGAIAGLRSNTRPIEALRAAMEAIAYRFALIIAALEPLAPDLQIICSGYALHSSRVWVQILADVLGRNMNVIEQTEASTRGAALLALNAVGKIRSLADFSLPIATVVMPDSSRHAIYQRGLERQQQMYERIFRSQLT